jgi:hypothetical protein
MQLENGLERSAFARENLLLRARSRDQQDSESEKRKDMCERHGAGVQYTRERATPVVCLYFTVSVFVVAAFRPSPLSRWSVLTVVPQAVLGNPRLPSCSAFVYKLYQSLFSKEYRVQ